MKHVLPLLQFGDSNSIRMLLTRWITKLSLNNFRSIVVLLVSVLLSLAVLLRLLFLSRKHPLRRSRSHSIVSVICRQCHQEIDPEFLTIERALHPFVKLLHYIVHSRVLNAPARRIGFPRQSKTKHAAPVCIRSPLTMQARDGYTLVMSHLFPRGHAQVPLPVVLIRTPYGRKQLEVIALAFARKHFHVITQDCRGRADSAREEGSADNRDEFFPVNYEEADGIDTLKWLSNQPFCNGRVGMYGMSYLGLTQFALIDKAASIISPLTGNPILCALCPINTASNLYSVVYPSSIATRRNETENEEEDPSEGRSGPLHLELITLWGYMITLVQDPDISHLTRFWRRLFRARRVRRAFKHLPVGEIDEHLCGRPISSWRQTMHHRDPQHPYWQDQLRASLCDLSLAPPTHIHAGWYDFFLRQSLVDFEKLNQSSYPGRHRLTVGPWHHWQFRQWGPVSQHNALDWFNYHLTHAENKYRKYPLVRLFVRHHGWMKFDSWPPRECEPVRWFLAADRQLVARVPWPVKDYSLFDHPRLQWSTYAYDPIHDPTPVIGGASFDLTNCGPMDQRPIESRKDVLVFTSNPLPEDYLIAGKIEACIYVTSTLDHCDLVVRLCDVDPAGQSVNLCDGIARVTPQLLDDPEVQSVESVCLHGSEGRLKTVWRVEVDVWATANLFRKGHSIRIHVTSGAHPRWARNSGKGSTICIQGRSDDFEPSIQSIYYGPGTRLASFIQLPTLFNFRERPSNI